MCCRWHEIGRTLGKDHVIIVEDGQIPYRPEMLAKKKANFEKRGVVDVISTDGMPAATPSSSVICRAATSHLHAFPFFEIVQSNGSYVLIAYEYASTSRTIRMNSNEKPPSDSWTGLVARALGEGDTLVVDVVGFNDLTWFHRAGDFHSDALHVVEPLHSNRSLSPVRG